MPSTCTTFSLHVKLGYGCDRSAQDALNRACSTPSSSSLVANIASSFFSASAGTSSNPVSFFVASASHVELFVDERKQSTSLVAVLVPPSLIDECLEKYTSTAKLHASGSCFWIKDSSAIKLSQDLLSSMHPSLFKSIIRGVVRTSIATEDNAPAEFVVLELPLKHLLVEDVLQATNGKALNADATAILKILPLSIVQFELPSAQASASTWMKSPPLDTLQAKPIFPSIPTCAVCLHRIDPLRLGFPAPLNEHLCSKFCPPPNLLSWTSELVEQSCPNQRFLKPWSTGARCRACRVIQQYWDIHKTSSFSLGVDSGDEDDAGASLYCLECSMHKTLWVCLTCGYVGCGRYSNRHSVQHFQETQHPYSLELATLRIWDYVHEDRFAHRVDLLECPSSPPLTQPWMAHPNHRASHYSAAASSATAPSIPTNYAYQEKCPKKATMIGEEYEALLQSALEDQAQHYEGEITRLRAELTASLVDHSSLTPQEQAEMEELQAEIRQLRDEIEGASKDLLDVQAKEAGHRATSQRLLQEQQEANSLIQKIEREAREEAERGSMQVEDLEQQVRDLTANLKMRQRFSQSEELNEAQIFGTNETPNRNANKRGKKKGRYFRK